MAIFSWAPRLWGAKERKHTLALIVVIPSAAVCRFMPLYATCAACWLMVSSQKHSQTCKPCLTIIMMEKSIQVVSAWNCAACPHTTEMEDIHRLTVLRILAKQAYCILQLFYYLFLSNCIRRFFEYRTFVLFISTQILLTTFHMTTHLLSDSVHKINQSLYSLFGF